MLVEDFLDRYAVLLAGVKPALQGFGNGKVSVLFQLSARIK